MPVTLISPLTRTPETTSPGCREFCQPAAGLLVYEELPPLLRSAVYGWIALAQNVIARWLQERDVTREAVCDLLVGALTGVIAAATDVDERARTALAVPVEDAAP